MVQDVFAEWLAENCKVAPDKWEPPRLLFNSWRGFADNAREMIGTQSQFTEKMESRGFHQGKDRTRGRYWDGIALKSRPIPQDVDF